MIIPPKLKKGDKVGIISTARKISRLEIKQAISILTQWDLEIVFGKYLFCEDNQFSGTNQQRTEDLQSMLDNSSIRLILCARGGYGTVQIIDNINFNNFKKQSKWIVGYSDITVLHSHLNNLRVSSIHATMPINFHSNTRKSLQSLYNTLFCNGNTIKISSNKFNRCGQAKGELVGGNLSIIYSLLGSSSDIDTKNKILFIEDLDEYLYHIDRMIINIKRNNKFKNLKGLIVGGMKDMNDNIVPYGQNAIEIISHYTKDYDFPICFDFPSGHINNNMALILGVETTFEVSKSNTIVKQNINS